ncbi:MAG: hypothetical protein JWP96_2607 [Polaromonas sp.]|nr:hypothetical protein [Polaromonas sp.]
MKTVLNIAFFVLVAASQCVQAHADDVVRIVNRLRAPGGACAANAPPVVSKGALDAAAARLARGASLGGALKAVGYRMTQVQAVSLIGEDLRAQLESLLAGRYCTQIGIPALSEAGVYEEGRQMWIVLAAPFAPKVAMTRQQMAERMLALVNEARAQPRRCGGQSFGAAPSLSWSEPLEIVASMHATDMAANNYFSHTARDGSTPEQRITRAGYRYRMSAENIAAGPLSPEEAVAGWLRSAPHCAALMNSVYTEMGVAVAVNATSAMGAYWVQLLGTPK